MKSFGYNGCVLWSELPDDIRSLQREITEPNFKVAVKEFLLSKIDWECMFIQYLDKFYFPSFIDLYGFKVFTPIFHYCF